MKTFFLMYKNEKVLKFDISVDINIFTNLKNVEIYNNDLLPLPLLHSQKTEQDFYFWFISRFFDKQRKDFFELTNFLHNVYSNREYRVLYFCSLYTYSFSLSDKYWLNPIEEYVIGGEFDYTPIKFTLKPTTYEELLKFTENPSEDINNIIKTIFFKNFNKLKDIKHENISLNTPNFTTYGNTIKTWKKENNEWICEKWYNENQKEEILKKIKISDTIRHLNLKYFITYKQESAYSISSKYFLNKNEEYIDLVQILAYQPIEELSDKTIFKIMKKFGLSQKLYNEYLKEKKLLQDSCGISDYEIWENLGFVINENKRVVNIVNRI